MKKAKLKNFVLIGAAVLIAVGLVIFAVLKITNLNDKFLDEKEDISVQKLNYQIDVLNACGVEDVAFQIAQYLRLKGFDVIDYGNYETVVNESFIIDHVGKPEVAKLIAKELGIDEGKITMSKEKYYNEFTVIIGKDYIMLKPFKNKVEGSF